MAAYVWIYIWIAVMALSLLIEFLTNKLITIWFIIGAVAGLVMAILELAWYIQLPVAVVLPIPFVVFLRKYILKKLEEKSERKKADPNIGKTFMLLSPIMDNELGTIKINEEVWGVETKDKSEIKAGTIVKILELKEDKYIVEANV